MMMMMMHAGRLAYMDSPLGAPGGLGGSLLVQHCFHLEHKTVHFTFFTTAASNRTPPKTQVHAYSITTTWDSQMWQRHVQQNAAHYICSAACPAHAQRPGSKVDLGSSTEPSFMLAALVTLMGAGADPRQHWRTEHAEQRYLT
jgi:hypothetical protein